LPRESGYARLTMYINLRMLKVDLSANGAGATHPTHLPPVYSKDIPACMDASMPVACG